MDLITSIVCYLGIGLASAYYIFLMWQETPSICTKKYQNGVLLLILFAWPFFWFMVFMEMIKQIREE